LENEIQIAADPVDPVMTDIPQPSINQERSFFRESLETILLIIAIYTFVNLATARFVVDGPSMRPNFHTDEYIIVSRMSYVMGNIHRGDVVVFHYDENSDYIKRVIGLPGETVTIRSGRVYINGELLDEPYIEYPYSENYCRGNIPSERCEWVVPDDSYFVLGDNRNSSKDSQDADVGFIERDRIVGRALVRYWPVRQWEWLSDPSYPDLDAIMPTSMPTNTPIPTTTPSDNPYLPYQYQYEDQYH
jgi:signal peptidase I